MIRLPAREYVIYQSAFTFTRILFCALLFYSRNSHFEINVEIKKLFIFRYVNKDRHSIYRVARIAFFI